MLSKYIKKLKHFYLFPRDLLKNRGILLELTKNDFREQYLGSYLGLFWAFAQPVAIIGILWFIFEVGFKSPPIGKYPFMLWLSAGMMPWFFLSDAVLSATSSITGKSYLVKKIVFRVGMLPIIKILSSLIVHLIFIGILLAIFVIYGYSPDLYNVQIVYYLFAAIVFTLGISWITSSLAVFLKDISYAMGIVLQFGFWLTPIFWSLTTLPDRYRPFIKLNPAYYIIEGYRDCLIHKIWFWEHGELTVYFWCVTGTIFVFGAVLFRKLKPHFADVL